MYASPPLWRRDNTGSQPPAHPPVKANEARHHAERRCTRTEAEHNDDHHNMGLQRVNAAAQRLSTMTATTVRAQAPCTTEGRRDAPRCRPMLPQGGTAGCQCTSPKAEHNGNRHSRGAPATTWHPARGPHMQPRRHQALQPEPVQGVRAEGGGEPLLWAGARPLLPTRPRRPAHGSFVAGFDSRRRPTTPSPEMRIAPLLIPPL